MRIRRVPDFVFDHREYAELPRMMNSGLSRHGEVRFNSEIVPSKEFSCRGASWCIVVHRGVRHDAGKEIWRH